MLLNVKYGFYKGCDQSLFKLLLGHLPIFWLNNASGTALNKFFSLETHAKKCWRNYFYAMLLVLFITSFLETHEKILDQALFFRELNFGIGEGGELCLCPGVRIFSQRQHEKAFKAL